MSDYIKTIQRRSSSFFCVDGRFDSIIHSGGVDLSQGQARTGHQPCDGREFLRCDYVYNDENTARFSVFSYSDEMHLP